MQVDATWKGRKHKFFAAIDQTYHYLFEFKEIRGENERSLAPLFKRLNSLCFNLKYVISDMAPGLTDGGRLVTRLSRGATSSSSEPVSHSVAFMPLF